MSGEPQLTPGSWRERLSSPRRLVRDRMKIDEVELAVPEGYQLILGQSHFIKTVEDLYETLASSMPGAKFGIAFCESSGKALIRYDGTDAESVKVAKEFAGRLSAGHAFVVILHGSYPINGLTEIKLLA